jgi:hypothetical protein
MANLFRNDLSIEGDNIQRALSVIGFKEESLIKELGVVLIDLPRIIPMPARELQGEWVTKNWGGSPYDGLMEGDLLELSATRVVFKFFTRHGPVQKIIWKLAERFPELKFTYEVREEVNDLVGGEVLEDGKQSLFVDLHFHPPTFIDDEACPSFVCDVQNCSSLFPPPSSEQLEHYRKRRGQNAIRMIEEFGAEAAS